MGVQLVLRSGLQSICINLWPKMAGPPQLMPAIGDAVQPAGAPLFDGPSGAGPLIVWEQVHAHRGPRGCSTLHAVGLHAHMDMAAHAHAHARTHARTHARMATQASD